MPGWWRKNLILLVLAICLPMLACKTVDYDDRQPVGLLQVRITVNSARNYGCRILEFSSSYPFNLEQAIPLAPASPEFNRNPSNLDVFLQIKNSQSIGIPIRSGRSLYILCEEDRSLTAQLHALKINLHKHASGIKPNCFSRGTGYMSSSSECNLLLPTDHSEEISLSLDLSRPVQSEDPFRACTFPFQGYERIWRPAPRINQRMVPRILVNDEVLLE